MNTHDHQGLVLQAGADAGRFLCGRVFAWRPPHAPDLETFLYLPRSAPDTVRALVCVHGITRNAAEHALRFSALAEKEGIAIVAPLFTRKRFRGYQTLRPSNHGVSSDLAFERMLDDLGEVSGLALDRLSLFGFSGGGQFAHRFAMTKPARVARLLVGAAGWYTFPDKRSEYPYGLAQTLPLKKHLPLNLEGFLRVPVRVIVGEFDDQRDPSLNQEEKIDRMQGRTRIERGRGWVEALGAAAAEFGMQSQASFRLLPHATHSFTNAMQHFGLGEEVFRFLFGTPSRNIDSLATTNENEP